MIALCPNKAQVNRPGDLFTVLVASHNALIKEHANLKTIYFDLCRQQMHYVKHDTRNQSSVIREESSSEEDDPIDTNVFIDDDYNSNTTQAYENKRYTSKEKTGTLDKNTSFPKTATKYRPNHDESYQNSRENFEYGFSDLNHIRIHSSNVERSPPSGASLEMLDRSDTAKATSRQQYPINRPQYRQSQSFKEAACLPQDTNQRPQEVLSRMATSEPLDDTNSLQTAMESN
ncbi:unnamed protein product, partial [Protopolystoma xenopodis]